MSDLRDDRDLEQRFEQLRSGDRVSLRSLEALLASRSWRIPSRPRSLRLAIAMLVVLLAVVATVIVQARLALDRRALVPVRVDADSVSWSGPTDFLLASAGLLAASNGERALRENLFPPELVLRNDAKLGLEPAQRAAISEEVQQLQIKIADLQSRMSDEGARLGDLLGREVVGENEVLAQLDRVLAVEREVKRAQLAMLVRVRNVLSAEQRKTLRALL